MDEIEDLLARIGWTRGRLASDVNASSKTIQRWCNLPENHLQRAKIQKSIGYCATKKYLEMVARILGV